MKFTSAKGRILCEIEGEFAGAFCDGAVFDRADFRDADHDWIIHFQATFRNADLRRVRLNAGDLEQASFAGANEENADLSRDNLNDSTSIQGACFGAANLRNTRFEGAPFAATPILPRGFHPDHEAVVFHEG